MSASLELWPSTPRRAGPPTRLDRLRRKLVELPCALLLFVQLTALLVYPYLETATIGNWRDAGRALFGIVGILVLFLAVRAVRATPALTWVAALLGVPVVLLTVAEAVWPDSASIEFWSALLHALFYFYTGYGLLRYMFADNWVTRDELYATGATFTVVAWGFAYLYLAVQFIWPNSFTIYGEADPGIRSWYELLYLSITTMTSTGLSDIYAVTPHARSFVLLQQIAGMLYVALVVARLVGLTIARFRQ
ncbi:Ion channel [Intrasporangium oryzae NRRL B-24470]|uniref:Ion channel n=1 Tax=Intrasporangium oryzae NRRL B-24470 TaxID=1386089 RepID=W9GF72_9MICO|nr:ion channel [Intrasporangium oryzae]EWT03478.1 Ion channel [Intrasporangium oryzae NRRL B-24470]